MKALLILLLATFALRSASAQTPPVVRFDPVPIAIGTLPGDWRLFRRAPTKKPPTTREELHVLLRESFATEVFTVTSPSTTSHMNPSLTVLVRLSSGQTPREELTAVLDRGSQRPAEEKFKVTKPPMDATVIGAAAVLAECQYSYLLPPHEYTMVKRLWIIQQKDLLFIISLVLRADEVEDLAADVEAILRSIQLTP